MTFTKGHPPYDGGNKKNWKGTLKQRFWRRVKIGKPTECWEWQVRGGSYRYGMIDVGGKNIGAHVVSYQIHKGRIPKGKFVCHTCDNGFCVNPAHLWLGTHTENQRDKIQKGRGKNQHGNY